MSKTALDSALEHFAKRKDSTLDVPEWGVTVHYAPLGLLERQRAVAGGQSPDEIAFRMAKLVVEHSKDANGEPLFGKASPQLIEDVQHKMDPAIVERIAVAILGVSSGAQAAKNSGTAPN